MRTFFYWSSVFIGVMNYSSQEITAPWLLPEMVERVATMLNYFLRHLAGMRSRRKGRFEEQQVILHAGCAGLGQG